MPDNKDTASEGVLRDVALCRAIIANAQDAIIAKALDGTVLSWNAGAQRIYGYTATEMIGGPMLRLFPYDRLTEEPELISELLLGRSVDHFVTRRLRKDGSAVEVSVTLSPVRDAHGDIVAVSMIAREVTAARQPAELPGESERKRAAHALLIANERFALAADAAGIGVWEWDLSSNVLRWDDQMYRLYGRISVAGVEPYSVWASSLHVQDRGRAEREIKEALRDNANFDTEFRIVLPGGEVRYLKAAAQIQTDGAGEALRMIGVNFDVTARKQAELDLNETSSLLRRVLDSASDLSIIATAPDHTIRVFNKAAEQLLGYAGAELIDKTTAMALLDADEVGARGVELTESLGRVVQGAGVLIDATTLDVPREWTFIRKDRRRVPVLLNISAMFDDSGILRGYLGVARDISRDRERDRSLLEAKSEAERANAAKSDFLSNMSHEIRTPLNAVIGLGYLLEQTPLNEEQRSFLRKINFAGHSLLEIINDILDLSKIEAGEMLLEDGQLDLKSLVQAVGEMLTASAHDKGLALLVHCAADLPPRLRGDATRLGQIVTNLLNNAIKFTEKGQVELELSCSKLTGANISVRLSVRDTGIGMDAKDVARLFRPFSQADTSTSRRFGGTGLGLSITSRLVALMGGQIGVTSTVGVGTEFWVEVPLRVADAAAHVIERALPVAPEASPGTGPLLGAKILVVDDSVVNREVAQLILRRQGASVATSGTGAEALERLRQSPATQIVLMDIQMPEMDGIEATRRIRTELQLKTLPIIALTAGALLSERERALQAGMNDYVTKPFEPAALIGIVRRYLEAGFTASLPLAPIAQADGLAPSPSAASQIDPTVARELFGEDTALFVSLLAGLVREFGEFASPVNLEPHDALALTHLMGRLHKLAGSAGVIGATTVHRLAAAAEATLSAGQAPDKAETLLRQLAAAFTALGEEVARMLAAVPQSSPALTGAAAVPIVPTPKCIDGLLDLLDDQNMDAMQQLRDMSPSLHATLGEARFAQLRDAVGCLDFAMAAAILRGQLGIGSPAEIALGSMP